ncbi:FHA domain-containing protein [Azonexus sp. IMCC34839]|uniref:FHA domain-containing protein n=1 Tax=Azonexus sp. IMCC34839 TaxID=3133695 RepID=UPI003999561E
MSATPRKLVVMFADVSGSSALFERLGDTEAMHAVERCLKRMSRSIDGYEGRTVQIVGDELLAVFNTADEACQAAIDMQQRIADLPPVSGLKLSIRIGLHCGEVIDEGNKLKGDAVETAARIAGLARRKEILCSSVLASEIPSHGPISLTPISELGTVNEQGKALTLNQVQWVDHDVSVYPHSTFGDASLGGRGRLSLKFRGKTFVLDDKSAALTIGRDLSNNLVIDDRKASRQHARIESRPDGFHLVDTSTNGTFLSYNGRPEMAVRRKDMRLEGKGYICFGGSSSDPLIARLEFEPA